MKKRIFRSILVTAFIVMLISSVWISSVMLHTIEKHSFEAIKSEASAICQSMQLVGDETELISSLESGYRLTLVDATGAVLYDNSADAPSMGSHEDRPEIISALQNGSGESRRISDTLAEQTFYYARQTPDGNILRLASTQSSIFGILLKILPLLLLLPAAIAAALLLTARHITAWIVKPVNSLNLQHPLENDTYDELGPLLERLEHQRNEINEHLAHLGVAQAERSAIMENMREGLVTLNSEGEVLTINASAGDIFGIHSSECIGRNILSLSGDPSVHDACRSAHAGSTADALLEKDGRFFRMFASPVRQGDVQIGIVLLLLDITDSYNAELSRREFTANVSHELKTPLTAISGFAEIIRDGVARPEDVTRFAERIHKEASRMIALLEDIFELSRLDERKGLGEKETVDLMETAREAASRLESAAENKKMNISISGESVCVTGYRALLVEMCYNLIDNAIRYTPECGEIRIHTGKNGGRNYLSVTDNGIGIAPVHQQHIFERFYRVDKSRSKAGGGTGLGLAIVKHGAMIHNASIELESDIGAGTVVKLIF